MERVLHINDYPIEAGGGAEVVVRQTVDLQRQAGLSVEVFTCEGLADQRRTALRYVENHQAKEALAAKLKSFQPQVVHLHNYYHALSPGILDTIQKYRQQRSLRIVMTAHDYHLICPNSGGSWFHWWTGRREPIAPGQSTSLAFLMSRRWDERTLGHSFLKLVQNVWNYRWHRRQDAIDLVICPSRFVQALVIPTGLPTCWLPHPVAPLPGKWPARNGPLHFVFAGRIEPEKGLFEFLQNLPDDLDARLTVIGDGNDRTRCQAVCVGRRWRGQIEFVGRLSHGETIAQIAAAHVLVQPSRVLETYGLTLIEALSVGTNLLTADRGALREVVDDAGIGYLVDMDNPAALAEAIAAIHRRYADGSLNAFDLNAFLSARSGTRYLEGLFQCYRGELASTSAKPSGTDANRAAA